MNKMELFLRKNSSTILSIVGATGVIATTVFAVKATPKALLILEEAEKEKGDKLTPLETVKVAWKPYIPAVVTGVSTTACIFGINYLNKKSQASLMSAYALLDSSYKEYRNKVQELHGDDSDVKREIAKSKFDENMRLDEEKELFFDYQSMRYFESTFEEVRRAEHIFKQVLVRTGFASLNEFYDILGIPRVDYGYQFGWSGLTENNISELEFIYEKTVSEDGLECWVVIMPDSPGLDYIY